MSDADAKKLEEAYKSYKKFCRANGNPIAPFAVFSMKMQAMVATVVARQIADKVPDASKAHYIAVRVEDIREPGVNSVMRSCCQCDQSCWIHRSMVDKADASKGVVCNHCAPELTGKSMSELIAEQMLRL